MHGVELYFKSARSFPAYFAWLTRREYLVQNVYFPARLVGDSELLTKFFQVCGPGLRRIKLGQCGSEDHTNLAFDSIVSDIIEHCHYLQELTLMDGFPENPNLLHQLSLRCPYIHKLTFRNCFNYKGDLNKDLSFFALRTLESNYTLLSDTLMEAIAIGSANLQALRLDRSSGVSSEGLKMVAAHCPLIQTVRMKQSTHSHMLAVITCCKNLQALEILYPEDIVTDDTLFIIAQHCPALHTLHLTKRHRITNVGVDEILKKCKRLRDLNLDYRMYNDYV